MINHEIITILFHDLIINLDLPDAFLYEQLDYLNLINSQCLSQVKKFNWRISKGQCRVQKRA